MTSAPHITVIVASIFISFALSARSVNQHLVLNKSSQWPVQRLHIRIIFAAPLLAALCSIALLVPAAMMPIDLVLALHEGYMLYLFFALIILHIGGLEPASDFLKAQSIIFECRVCQCIQLRRFQSASEYLDFLARTILQYPILKSLCTLVRHCSYFFLKTQIILYFKCLPIILSFAERHHTGASCGCACDGCVYRPHSFPTCPQGHWVRISHRCTWGLAPGVKTKCFNFCLSIVGFRLILNE